MSSSLFITLGVILIIIGIAKRADENKPAVTPTQPQNSQVLEAKIEEIVKKEIKPISEKAVPEKPTSESGELSNAEKGRLFEEYIVSRLNNKYFKIINWRSDKSFQGNFPETNKYPDLEYNFVLRDIKEEFSIECKWRSNFHKGIIDLGKEQMDRYRRFSQEKKMPVFIALGVGGTPKEPNQLYIFSAFAGDHEFNFEALKPYSKNPKSMFFYEYKEKRFK